MRISLALIESKMAQAKAWLKDPHGPAGNRSTLTLHSATTCPSPSPVSRLTPTRSCPCPCLSCGRGPRGACGARDPGRGGQGGGAVCWEGAERRAGNHQSSGPDDRPGGRPAGQVVCLGEIYKQEGLNFIFLVVQVLFFMLGNVNFVSGI